MPKKMIWFIFTYIQIDSKSNCKLKDVTSCSADITNRTIKKNKKYLIEQFNGSIEFKFTIGKKHTFIKISISMLSLNIEMLMADEYVL